MTYISVVPLALFAGVEGGYGVTGSLGAATAVQVHYDKPEFTVEYSDDGDRGGSQMTGATLTRAGQTGRTVSADIAFEIKGAASDYTMQYPPTGLPNIYPFFRASGCNVDNGGTVGAGSWSISPESAYNTTPASLQLRAVQYGQDWTFYGGLCSFKIGADGPGAATVTFSYKGLASAPVELLTAPAAIFSGSAVVGPKMTNAVVTIGGYTPKVMKWSFDQGREITANNASNNSATHGGFRSGNKRAPKLTMTIEQDALSNFNPHAAMASGATGAINITVGTVQFNRFTLSLPYAQLISAKPGVDGQTATWEVEYACNGSGPDQNNDFQIQFN